MTTAAPKYPIESVDNALRLLVTLRDSGSITVQEASRQLEVAPSTAHRLLQMLHYHGFVEQDPATLKPDELPFFRAADQADSVVPTADVLLITGTTLINDTLEQLLALAKPTARVTMVGPTVSLLPDPLLRRGVSILGSVRIVAPDAFLDLLAEGGSGYHFLGRSAQKVVLVRRSLATAKLA